MTASRVLRQLAIAVFLTALAVHANQAKGMISGTLADEHGAPLPGVEVTASSPGLVSIATTRSAERGAFRLPGLPPGMYRLTFTLPGFKTSVLAEIRLEPEQTIDLKVAMQPQPPTGQAERALSLTGNQSSAMVAKLARVGIKRLPKGRDFSTLLEIVPGAMHEPLQGNGLGYSIEGASAAENAFYVDGMDTTDIRSGEQAQEIAVDLVEEVQVKTLGLAAASAGSLGGVINVVTRSGGDEFHGDVVAYFEGSALSGKERDSLRNYYDWSEYVNYQDLYGQTTWDRMEGGIALGGPIARDKVWFFASVLPAMKTSHRDVTFIYAAHPADKQGSFEKKESWMNVQGKITSTPVEGLRISLSGMNNFFQVRGDLPPRFGSGSAEFTWADWGWKHRNYSFSGAVDFTAGNNLQIRAHGGYFFRGQRDGLVPSGPIYVNRRSIPASFNMPADLYRPSGWTNWGNAIEDAFIRKTGFSRASAGFDVGGNLRLAGEHSWKTGCQWSRISDDSECIMDQPYVRLNFGRQWSPYTVDPITGKYGYYEVRQPFGIQVDNAHSDRMAVYLQDSWTIANRLTINVGVRAESEKVPALASAAIYPGLQGRVPLDFGFGDKIAPRLGFAWDARGDSSLIVSGSFGIYHDAMKLAMPEKRFGGSLWTSTYYTLDTLQWNAIGVNNAFPGAFIERIDANVPLVEAVDPDIKPMSQREFSVGMVKKFGANWVVSGRFVSRHLIRAIEDINIVTPAGSRTIIGNPGFGLSRAADPRYPACPRARRDYDALHIALEKRFSGRSAGGISLCWSRLRGNYSGLESSEEPLANNANSGRGWDYWFTMFDSMLNPIDGPLPGDRPLHLKLYGSYLFPFGMTVGASAFAYSGIPVSTRFLVNGQELFYPGNRFDTGKRTPFVFYANLYAEYAVRLGRNRLSFNVNVENVNDAKTARRLWELYNSDLPYLSDAELLAANWDYKKETSELDDRYMKAYDFFPPMQIRFGAGFSF